MQARFWFADIMKIVMGNPCIKSKLLSLLWTWVARAHTVRPLRCAKERALGSVGLCCLVDLKDARYLAHKEARVFVICVYIPVYGSKRIIHA